MRRKKAERGGSNLNSTSVRARKAPSQARDHAHGGPRPKDPCWAIAFSKQSNWTGFVR